MNATPTVVAPLDFEPPRPFTLGIGTPKIPLEARLFIISGQRDDGRGYFVDTFSEEILGVHIEEFVAELSMGKTHRGCELPKDWRERLARSEQIEMFGATGTVVIVEVGQ